MTTQFQAGHTYCTRSLCDWDTIYSFRILKRTPKSVTVNVCGEVVRRGIQIYDGVEKFEPFGTYSMSPTIWANKEEP
jgi:hypothetical protein